MIQKFVPLSFGFRDDDTSSQFLSDDYANLYHLVTHSERREPFDVATKTVFAAFLLRCLKSAGYFKTSCTRVRGCMMIDIAILIDVMMLSGN